MPSPTKPLALAAAVMLGAAGCAQSGSRVDYRRDHPPQVDEEMVRWNGRPAAELVKEWGPPRSVKKLEEQRLEYTYPRPDIDGSCVHFWLLNRQNYVIGHRHEGDCDE